MAVVSLVTPEQSVRASTRAQSTPARVRQWQHKTPAKPPPIMSTSVVRSRSRAGKAGG